jgi:hypothetical protein
LRGRLKSDIEGLLQSDFACRRMRMLFIVHLRGQLSFFHTPKPDFYTIIENA